MQNEMALKPGIPQGDHFEADQPPDIRPSAHASDKQKKSARKQGQPDKREAIRRKMRMKFIKLVSCIVGVFLLVGAVVVMLINGSQAKRENDRFEAVSSELPVEAPTAGPPEEEQQPGSIIPLPPAKTNFFVVGKDAGDQLTDVILVGCFDRDSRDITIISIPRDTMTVIPPERLKRMNDLGLYPPSDGTMKINSVNSYGREYGMQFLQEQLEDLLGIDIQYNVVIDLQAFRSIVDELGGVYFDVPAGGLHYKDPYQSLVIDIPGGFQYLDGVNAEGLVRYRATYRDGDVQRIGVQHEFMKAMFNQVLERENIVGNAFSVVKAVIGYSKTNFSVTEAPKYLRYVKDIDSDKLNLHILPGQGEYVGGVSYFLTNEEQMRELVNDTFFKVTPSEEAFTGGAEPEAEATPTKAPQVSSVGLRIEILNGSGKTGVAGAFKEEFEKAGLTVAKIDNYTAAQMDQTQILVRSAGRGADLEKYFKDPVVQVAPDLPADYDIIIITGRSEA